MLFKINRLMSGQDIGSIKKKVVIIDKLKSFGFHFNGGGDEENDRLKLSNIGRKIPWKLLDEIISIVETVHEHRKGDHMMMPFINDMIFCDTLQLKLHDDGKMNVVWADTISDRFITVSKSKPVKLPIKVTKDHIVSLCISIFGAHITHIKFPPTINYPVQWFICVLFLLINTFPTESKNETLIQTAQQVLLKMRRKELDGLGYTQTRKVDLHDVVITPILERTSIQ